MRQSAVAQATSRPSGSFPGCWLAGSDPEPTVEKMKAANHSKRGKTKAAIQNAK